MRLAILAFVAAAAASPFPFAENEALSTSLPSLPASTSGSKPNATRTGHHNPHKEPTPTFKAGCDCEKPIVPAGMMNQNEQCQYEYYLNMACYNRAQGGCPSPTLTC